MFYIVRKVNSYYVAPTPSNFEKVTTPKFVAGPFPSVGDAYLAKLDLQSH